MQQKDSTKDADFSPADVRDEKKAEAVFKVIRERLDKYHKERPGGYLVREAPVADVRALKVLAGHLRDGQFLTKFRKTFTKAENERRSADRASRTRPGE